MKIHKAPITEAHFITLFEGSRNKDFSISSDGHVVFNRGKALETNFLNLRERFPNHKMLGLVTKLTEEKVQEAFKGIGINAPYINYMNRSQTTDSALDSLKSFIETENWDISIESTWVIFPKPSKQLTGKKIMIEFEVGAPDFGNGSQKMELEVFMSPITKTSKSVTFSMKVPEFLYNKCMTDPDITKRPTQDYIKTESLSGLHTIISNYVSQAHGIWDMDRKAAQAKKVICINFNSSEISERDEWNHAYTGQRIKTSFNFFVAYNTKGQNSWLNGDLFSYKKIQSGNESTSKGIKGIIDSELQGKRNWIRTRPQVIIEWTQEREDFLTRLEEKFRSLSENLNSFLKDLNEEKLENLIQNSETLKLIN